MPVGYLPRRRRSAADPLKLVTAREEEFGHQARRRRSAADPLKPAPRRAADAAPASPPPISGGPVEAPRRTMSGSGHQSARRRRSAADPLKQDGHANSFARGRSRRRRSTADPLKLRVDVALRVVGARPRRRRSAADPLKPTEAPERVPRFGAWPRGQVRRAHGVPRGWEPASRRLAAADQRRTR